MADPTASTKPGHHVLVTDDVETTYSRRNDDSVAADAKSNDIVTSDRGVANNSNEPVTGATEPSSQVQQYEDLVSKIGRLENVLARVDQVVQRELIEPLVDDYQGTDEMRDDTDMFWMEEEFRRYVQDQNSWLRENTWLLRSMRHQSNFRRDRRNRTRFPDKKMPDDEGTVNAETEFRATVADRLAEMHANGIPATCLRTTWAQFSAIPLRSRMERQTEKRNESLINPFELLVGEPESTLVGSSERKPASTAEEAADVVAPGEVPLPERILFHSPELLDILNSIHGGKVFGGIGDPPGSQTSIPGLLRPFKMLGYYEKKLRNYAASLQAKEVRAMSRGGHIVTSKDDSGGGSRTVEKESENKGSHDRDIKQDNSIRLLHIQCLLDFIDNEVNARKKYLGSWRCEKVTFSDLWHLFQPGSEVVDQDNKQAYRVVRVMMPKHNTISPWQRFRSFNNEDGGDNLEKSAKIHCIYIDFDGEKIGPVSRTFEIPLFDQEKLINSLPIYPLRVVREPNYRDGLAERGRMLWAVIQVRPMHYAGHTIDTREEADSQVMIDFTEAMIHAAEYDKKWKPHVDYIPVSFEKPSTAGLRKSCRATCCYGQRIHDDSYVDVWQTEQFIKSQLERRVGERPSLMVYPQTVGEILDAHSTPNKNELVLMSYRAFGFILRSRKWAQLDLTYMRYENEAKRTKVLSAFDQLILPEGHQEMIKSLVTQHFREKRVKERNADMKEPDAKMDLIRGKGQGLVILLHGAPGVGKTTTAEGIAETFKKPLFQITSGDLGTTASEVQGELEKNFTLASRWDCILLLDEAEVFLASRDKDNFQRNGLVAVFLRVLEYYTGILFLTTNRVGDFDEAFASRIHMSLHYPKLDLQKTLRIFRVNMQLINDKFEIQKRNIFLDEEAVVDFAQKHFEQNESNNADQDLLWNGRQIRNACQTALAMAEFEALDSKLSDEIDPSPTVYLKIKHFKIIEEAYNDFARYLGETYGVEMDERMAEAKVRANPNSPTTTRRA